MSEIVNRVANSPIVTIDLEELYLPGERVLFDLKEFLFQELILKEQDFRQSLKVIDWEYYRGKYVGITCTADAIVPNWAFILVGTYLQGISKAYVIGGMESLEQFLFERELQKVNLEKFKDKPVVIKGCSKFPVPLYAYGRIVSMIQAEAKSIMYGEPCSTVPLFKNKK
jgi:hypothetical protein